MTDLLNRVLYLYIKEHDSVISFSVHSKGFYSISEYMCTRMVCITSNFHVFLLCCVINKHEYIKDKQIELENRSKCQK